MSVFPGYYRHGVSIPNCKWESGYHPWEAAPGLSYFSYRYELEWKDQVYCDVAYFAAPGEADGDARLVRCEFVNNTGLDQQQVLHFMAYLNFPPVRPYSEEPVLPAVAHLPEGAQWIDALDYDDLQYAAPRPSDTLVYEGWMRGEVRAHGFVHGTGIGCGFGLDSGDQVTYTFTTAPLEHAVLLVRFRAPRDTVTFDLSGPIPGEVTFAACEDFQLCPVPLGPLAAGEHTLALTSRGGGVLELDGFALLEEGLQNQVSFTLHTWDPVPRLEAGPGENTLLLHYPDLPTVYGLAWRRAGLGGAPDLLQRAGPHPALLRQRARADPCCTATTRAISPTSSSARSCWRPIPARCCTGWSVTAAGRRYASSWPAGTPTRPNWKPGTPRPARKRRISRPTPPVRHTASARSAWRPPC